MRNLIASKAAKIVKWILTTGKTLDEPVLVAYRIDSCGITNICELPTNEKAKAIPHGLVIERGVYRLQKRAFKVDTPGVYRFYQLGRVSHQRILAPDNLGDFLQCIGYLWSHGTADDHLGKSVPDMLAEAGRRLLFLSCTNLAFLAQEVLLAHSYPVRVALGVQDGPGNGWDDGHTLLEIWDGSKWILYDPAHNCCFRRNNERLNLLDLNESLGDDSWQLESLNGNPVLGQWNTGGIDCTFWIAHRALCTRELKCWYQQVFQVPMIKKQGIFYGIRKPNLLSNPGLGKNCRVMSRAEFEKHFYSGVPELDKQ